MSYVLMKLEATAEAVVDHTCRDDCPIHSESKETL